MQPDELPAVHDMMRALWPDFDGADAAGEQVMVYERPASEGGGLGGFVSFSIRARAEACDTSPVPYVEGWWVAPELRRKGVGRELIAAVERWAKMCGFKELGSDADSVNALGVMAHKSLGFEERARMVFFRKKL